MQRDSRPAGQRNQLGIWGWLGGGRWGYERYLYTLHRLTGVGLVVYFIIHIIVTSSKGLGETAWNQAMDRVTGGVFTYGEFAVFIAFAFHALNGIRLILVELGWGVGKPIEPIYPYKTSLNVQRPLAIGAMLLAVVLVVLGGLDIFVLH
jgi:succinate dehydrogenase / fumarate reductase cytochrome b subunit